MRIHKTKKGYMLAEAILSITILIMTASAGIWLVAYGYEAVNYNKNSLIAGMLARECEQSVKGFRDTNWLRFGYDRTNCWNANGDSCPGSKFDTVGGYRLEVSLNEAPSFTFAGSSGILDLSDGISAGEKFYQLNYVDLNSAKDSDEDGDAANDRDGFTTAAGLGESKFYRMVRIINAGANTIETECVVSWQEGSDAKQIALPVVLTNY